MIAVYAMGGGLGHLARARRVLAALDRGPEEAAVLTASPFATGPGIVHVPRRLASSRAAFGDWLEGTLRELQPSAVVVDAFPLGILGELADHGVLPDVPLIHVARLLKWDPYRCAFGGTPHHYDATLAVEALTPAHERFLRANSDSFLQIELGFERAGEATALVEFDADWLVVHSGPTAEVRVLLDFATAHASVEGVAPRFVVVSPRPLELPAGVRHLEHPRAWELFPRAARIITACGFNAMQEAAPYASKHLYLPFERRFDDQFLRAARAAERARPQPSP